MKKKKNLNGNYKVKKNNFKFFCFNLFQIIINRNKNFGNLKI